MATSIESARAPWGREPAEADDGFRRGWLGPVVEPALRDEKAQSQYEGLTMRENGDPPHTLWVNVSHEQMNEAITQDANPATVAETSEEWVRVGDDLGMHQKTLGDAINASTSNWQGDAGDAVREHFAGVGEWLGATAQGATLAGRQQEIHSQALNETQRQMAANPPVQFDLQSTNQRLMSMTDPVQYAAVAGQATQTYREQQAAREHAARTMTQYDQTIAGAVATPKFPAPPKLPSAVGTATQDGATGGTRPLTAWSAGESPAAFDGVGGGAGTSGTQGAGAGPGFAGSGILEADGGGGPLSTFDRLSRSGLPGSGTTGITGIPGGSDVDGAGFPDGGVPGGSGIGPSGFAGNGIPGSGTGTPPSLSVPDLRRGSSFSGAGIPGSSVPGLDDSTTSSGFTPSGIDGSGGSGSGGGIGFAPMPLSIPDASGGGVRGGSSLTGGGLAVSDIDPITGLPANAGGTGGTKLPAIGRGGGINGESIGSRLGGPGGAGSGPSGGAGTGGIGASGGANVRGAGSLGGGATSGLAADAEAAAARGATSGRGAAGAAGSPGMGATGAGTRKEENKEHRAASYLESGDPDFFAGEQVVAPPVIGDWTDADWK